MTGLPSNREEVSRWLSDLPAGWTLRRLKYLLVEVDLRSDDGDGELLSLSKSLGVVPRTQLTADDARAESLVGYKTVRAGDLVMNKMQAWNGLFGLSRHAGLISPDYAVFEIFGAVEPRWLAYCLRSDFYAVQFTWRSRGMGKAFLRLHPENLLDTPIPVPPPADQRKIADFLDAQTAANDAVVTTLKSQIELLQERRASLVNSVILGQTPVSAEGS